MICAKCGHDNPGDTQFCTNCHQTLIYRCPKCWHEQRHGGACGKCGLDMTAYWNTYGAKQNAALIAEERTNLERSSKEAASLLESFQWWPYGIWAVMRSLAARSVWSRIPGMISRLWPRA